MSLKDSPPELTSLDARIANAGGTSSRIELQPHRLHQEKDKAEKSTSSVIRDLVRENGYLRQEIVYYQESRNAMLAFHSECMQSYNILQVAFKELSEKMAIAEGRIERYWGITLYGCKEKDLTML